MAEKWRGVMKKHSRENNVITTGILQDDNFQYLELDIKLKGMVIKMGFKKIRVDEQEWR